MHPAFYFSADRRMVEPVTTYKYLFKILVHLNH